MITKEQFGKIADRMGKIWVGTHELELDETTKLGLQRIEQDTMAFVMCLHMAINENDELKKALSVMAYQYADLYERLYNAEITTTEEEHGINQEHHKQEGEPDFQGDALKGVSSTETLRRRAEEELKQEEQAG